MTDADIAKLSAAEKLALAQRLLAALGQELGAPLAISSEQKKPLSAGDLSALQASMAVQVHQALQADPGQTDWNAIRRNLGAD